MIVPKCLRCLLCLLCLNCDKIYACNISLAFGSIPSHLKFTNKYALDALYAYVFVVYHGMRSQVVHYFRLFGMAMALEK